MKQFTTILSQLFVYFLKTISFNFIVCHLLIYFSFKNWNNDPFTSVNLVLNFNRKQNCLLTYSGWYLFVIKSTTRHCTINIADESILLKLAYLSNQLTDFGSHVKNLKQLCTLFVKWFFSTNIVILKNYIIFSTMTTEIDNLKTIVGNKINIGEIWNGIS